MSAFDTLRDAAKQQRGESQDPPRADRRGAQLDLHLERATSHPGIACAVEAIAAAPVVPPHERKKREQSPRNAAPLAQDSKGETSIEIEPVVEPQSLSGDRPFWAHAADPVRSKISLMRAARFPLGDGAAGPLSRSASGWTYRALACCSRCWACSPSV